MYVARSVDLGRASGISDDGKHMGNYISKRNTSYDNVSILECESLQLEECTPRFSFQVGACSEVGARNKNDDSYHIEPGFICVSDGIGGAPFGDIMSRICCQALRDEVLYRFGGTNAQTAAQLEEMLVDAFVATDELATRIGRYLGGSPGATLVAALATERDIAIVSVGDSMAFTLEGRELRRAFSNDGRAAADGSSELSSALGYGILSRSRACVQVAHFDPHRCDSVVLCSDGVWSQIDEREMNGEALLQPEPRSLAEALVHRAVCSMPETSDNATAVVMRVVAVSEIDSLEGQDVLESGELC